MKSISFDQLKTMLKSMSYPIFSRIGRAEKNVQSLTDQVSDLKTQIPAKPPKIIFRQNSSNEYTCDLTFDDLWAMEPEQIASNAILIDRYGVENAARSARKGGSVEYGFRNIQVDIDGSFEADMTTYFKPTFIIDWWANAYAATINVHTASSLSKKTTGAIDVPNVPILRAGNWGNYEVGEGLQINGDALEVVPEGEYEFIEKIIIGYELLTAKPDDWDTNWTAYYKAIVDSTYFYTDYEKLTDTTAPTWEEATFYRESETVQMVSRANELNGVGYCFKYIWCEIEMAVSDKNQYLTCVVRTEQNTYTSAYLSSGIVTTGKRITQLFSRAQNGHMLMYVTAPVKDYNQQPTCFLPSNPKSFRAPVKYINRIQIGAQNEIPRGSTIRIYGVRANV